jgi:hypothetical protein
MGLILIRKVMAFKSQKRAGDNPSPSRQDADKGSSGGRNKTERGRGGMSMDMMVERPATAIMCAQRVAASEITSKTERYLKATLRALDSLPLRIVPG